MLIFHVVDERDARAWQSGLYYGNGTAEDEPRRRFAPRRSPRRRGRSPSAPGQDDRERRRRRRSAARRRRRPTRCRPGSRATCRAPTSCRSSTRRRAKPVASAGGKAVGPATVKIPAADLQPGQYEYALRAFKCGKPGTAETRFSTRVRARLGRREVGAAADARAGRPVIRRRRSRPRSRRLLGVGSSSAAKPQEHAAPPVLHRGVLVDVVLARNASRRCG